MKRRRALLPPLLLLGSFSAALATAPLSAQQDPVNRAFDMERRGNYAAAVDAYRAILAQRPADPSALLGLERSLLPLNRADEILPQVRAALAEAAPQPAVFGVALRVYPANPDTLRRIAERWAAAEPSNEAPYREWGAALIGGHDRPAARAAYLAGRERLGRPDALAPELAQLAAGNGDYIAAAHEWAQAIAALPGYRSTAVTTLAPVPERLRPDLLRALGRERAPAAERLGGELRARWGDPVAGYRRFAEALPADRVQAIELLRQLAEVLRGLTGPDARRAQGMALEAIARRMPPPQDARVRLDAAQAYADAGAHEDARRMLGGLAADHSAPAQISAGASATLVGVLIDGGRNDEAERRLSELQRTMPRDDYLALRRRVIAGWIHTGRLARADSALASDSTVDGLALAGRVSVYRGDLVTAMRRLQAAGPFAGTRQEATARTALLALIQPFETDSVPALGVALLALDRGDSAAAVDGLERLAVTLPPEKGAAELRLLAGRIERARGHLPAAERLLRAAAVEQAPATAPAAELELARLLIAAGRREEAVPMLEHLILTYAESALVPQARRELDLARGAIPRT